MQSNRGSKAGLRARGAAAQEPETHILDDHEQEERLRALQDEMQRSTRFWSSSVALLGPILAFVHGMLYVIWLPGLVPLSLVGFSCLQHLLVSYFCLNDVRDLARVNPRSKLQIVLALASVIPIAWSMCLKSASHVALVYLLNLAHGALAWYLGVAALESERDLAGLASLRYNLKSA